MNGNDANIHNIHLYGCSLDRMNNQTNRGHPQNRIKSVKKMFEVVYGLVELEQAGASQLARYLEIPKSTAHIHLKTLEDEGYVVNVDGQYRPSLRFLELGGKVRQNLNIYGLIRGQIDDLSSDTGEVANLGIEEGGRRVLVYSSEPSGGVFDNSPVGEYTHMHWTALGKALLAQLSDSRIIEIIDEFGLPKATDQTITDRNELLAEIDQVRKQGFSIENEERREGIKSLAVGVEYDENPSPVAAVSISGPKRRISSQKDEELIDTIGSAANVVELQYKHYHNV